MTNADDTNLKSDDSFRAAKNLPYYINQTKNTRQNGSKRQNEK